MQPHMPTHESKVSKTSEHQKSWIWFLLVLFNIRPWTNCSASPEHPLLSFNILLCKTVIIIPVVPLYVYMYLYGDSLVAQMVKNPPAMQETWVWSLVWEDQLQKGMATHCIVLTWRIPWTEEPDGLQYMGHKELDMAEWLIYMHV